jgi:hypothetical protein
MSTQPDEVQVRVDAAVAELQGFIRELSMRAANLAADLSVVSQQKALIEGQLRSVQAELDTRKAEKADAPGHN